ncbi:MAG: modified peptide precursor CbpA [Verrucomicrobiota bacterium]|nr:modified peptide precursor CbpA [Verrucomicrobiota bacterium]
MKRSKAKKSQAIVARRKACKANGAGLSHYILMDSKAK